MSVPIDDEGNLFRCVDAQTKRATVQRVEIGTSNFEEIEKLIVFLSKQVPSLSV